MPTIFSEYQPLQGVGSSPPCKEIPKSSRVIEIGPGRVNRIVGYAIAVGINIQLDIDVIQSSYRDTGIGTGHFRDTLIRISIADSLERLGSGHVKGT